MTPIELDEWEEREVSLTPTAVQALAEHAGSALAVSPANRPGTYRIKASSYVGGFESQGLSVLVRPKADVDNVFAMLGVATSSLEWQRQRLALSEASGLLEATVHLFISSMEAALRGGLRRDYERRRMALRALRGRPDFARIAATAGADFPIPCSYSEYSADLALNRFLVNGLRVCRRVPRLAPVSVRRLRRLEAAFEDVGAAPVDLAWGDTWEPTRLDRRFEPAVRLASLILRQVSVRDRAGGVPVAAFWLNMNDVFEKWITAGVARALRGAMTVGAQVSTHLDVGRRVGLRPDIVATIDRRMVGVADCKYKLVAGEGGNPDYYQALAYATALGLPAATLIYAKLPGTEDVPPLGVRHSQITLHTLGVDLSVPAPQLDCEIDALAGRLRSLWAATSLQGS